MKTRTRLAIAALLILAVCVFGTVGCSSQQPTQAQLDKIYNDKSLTADERSDKLLALQPDPSQAYVQVLIWVGSIGGIGLLGGLLVKQAMDADARGEIYVPGSSNKNISPKRTNPKAAPPKASAKSPTKPLAKAPTQPITKSPTGPITKSPTGPITKSPTGPITKSPTGPITKSPTGPIGSPASYMERLLEPEAEENKLPENQAEVDAIPPGQRSMSYFTSRPLPREALHAIVIRVGGQHVKVLATEQEAARCQSGNVPMVRAFTIKGKTVPWYQWAKYDPYKHYWAMDDRGWGGTKDVISCWLKVDSCDSDLHGYVDR